MKTKKNNVKLILFFILLLAIFAAVAIFTVKQTFSEKKAGETLSEIDYYSMQTYSDTNVKLVMDALKAGKPDKLKGSMKNMDGIDSVMGFADWSNANFKQATRLGAGSLSAKPDANGLMDVSERLFVDVGGTQYVLFVETVTSRWGRDNDGISAIAATSFEHFDELNYAWSGEPDDESVLAGSLFWTGNQQIEQPAASEAPAATEGTDSKEGTTE